MSINTGKSITEFAHYLKRDAQTHTRRVQNLFKRLCRNEEAWEMDRHEVRYRMVLMRSEFEKHRHVKDMRVGRALLEEGERYLFQNIHPQPKYFTYSPGGVAFERYAEHPDLHADHWNAYEKARYPYYFAKRELRKKEYIEMWERNAHNNPNTSQETPQHH